MTISKSVKCDSCDKEMCKDGYEEYGYELKASIFGFTTSQVRMEDYTIPPKEVDAKHFCSIGCLKKYILDNIK